VRALKESLSTIFDLRSHVAFPLKNATAGHDCYSIANSNIYFENLFTVFKRALGYEYTP
jgi:hypothetical protein